MFHRCYSLKTIDTSNWYTPNATYMTDIFYNCYSLEKLDLSNFDRTNVYTIDTMFYNCYGLKTLKLGHKFFAIRTKTIQTNQFHCII